MDKYRRIGGSCWLDLQDRPINCSQVSLNAHYRLSDFTSRSRKHQSSLFFSQNIPRNISLLVNEFIRDLCYRSYGVILDYASNVLLYINKCVCAF